MEVAQVLCREGHEVHRLVDQLPITTSDSKVFDYAKSNGWITVTCNRKDFLPLAASGPHAGLIILIRRRTRQSECGHLLRLIRIAGELGLSANVNHA